MLRTGKLLSFGSLLLFVFLSSSVWSQGIFATLTGVVTDPQQSVVPNAKVTLTDAGSGSQRQTVSNAEGYFTFASVPVGNYNLSVEAQGDVHRQRLRTLIFELLRRMPEPLH